MDKSALVRGIRVILNNGRSANVVRVGVHTVRLKDRDGDQFTADLDDIAEIVVKTCDRCKKKTAVPGERYCDSCRIIIQQEIEKTRKPYVPIKTHEQRGRKVQRSPEWMSGQSTEDDYSEDSEP